MTRFRLNVIQEIEVYIGHLLYNDILIAVLANQDIDPIVQDALNKLGYIHGSFNRIYYKKNGFERLTSIIKL